LKRRSLVCSTIFAGIQPRQINDAAADCATYFMPESSPCLPADLQHPAAFRWLAYYFLWIAHLIEPLPLATALAVIVFVAAHLDVLRWPQRWSLEMILAVVTIAYVTLLLVVHSTIFIGDLGELARRVRIPYRLIVFMLFAMCDYRLMLEGPLLTTGMRVGCALAAVSLFYYFTDQTQEMFGRPFVMGENLVGLFGNHNVMASAMGALCVGAFAWWLHKRTFKMQLDLKLPELAALPVLAVAFLMSKSRSFMLAALCVGLYAGFLRRGSGLVVRLGSVALTIVAMIAGIYVLSTRDTENAQNNIHVRLKYYQRAAEMVPLSPIIGIGVGTFSEEKVSYSFQVPGLLAIRDTGELPPSRDFREIDEGAHVHNMYLETMLDVGLVGVVLLGTLFYSGVRRYLRMRKLANVTNDPSSQLERACLNGDMFMASLVFLLVSGLFSGFTLFGIPSSLILYAALGRMVALSQHIEGQQELSG